MKKQVIYIDDSEISLLQQGVEDYISLTDMAHSQMQEHIILKWLSLKSTIEYLGEWELLYNPNFNYTDFGTIKNAAGSNNFVLSVKTWIEKTNAIGIVAKAGRYGGTYAHKDIAYHFGMWITQNGDEIVFEFSARSFLHHQVRNMVGTLVEIGLGKSYDIDEIFAQKKREAAGVNAPSSGLYFVSATYATDGDSKK